MKNKVTTYRCTGRTDATDRANLYYIASPTARRIETDITAKEIRIFGKSPAPLAVFVFQALRRRKPKQKNDIMKNKMSFKIAFERSTFFEVVARDFKNRILTIYVEEKFGFSEYFEISEKYARSFGIRIPEKLHICNYFARQEKPNTKRKSDPQIGPLFLYMREQESKQENEEQSKQASKTRVKVASFLLQVDTARTQKE